MSSFDLCHVGCARMAGQKSLIKFSFFWFSGEFARALLPGFSPHSSVSSLSLPFPSLSFLSVHLISNICNSTSRLRTRAEVKLRQKSLVFIMASINPIKFIHYIVGVMLMAWRRGANQEGMEGGQRLWFGSLRCFLQVLQALQFLSLWVVAESQINVSKSAESCVYK